MLEPQPNSGNFNSSEQQHVPTHVLIYYGIGDISITVSMVIFGLFILFFYNSVMNLPGLLVGIGSAIGLVWDAIIDPYIGHRSDQSQSRFGRRHSFMLMGAASMGACFWLLFSPSPTWEKGYIFLWLLVTTLLFRTTSALFRIPYLSLGAELSTDYHQRTMVVAARSFFGLLGTLLASTLSFVIFFPDSTSFVDPKLNYAGYPKMGLAFGLVLSLAGFITIWGTWKNRRMSTSARTGTKRQQGYIHGFWVALKNRSFRQVWTSYFLFQMAVVLMAVVSVHYFNWYAKVGDSNTIARIQACFYLGALSGVFCWVRLSKKYDKHKLYIVSILCTGSLLLGAYFLIGKDNLFGIGNPMPLYLGHGLAGIVASGVWVLPSSMLADICDEDEFSTGLRREGIFFGILNFGEKMASGFSILIAGLFVQYFIGLIPGESDQPPMAQQRIGLVFGVLPAIILVFAALQIRTYKIDRKTLTRIQAAIKR